MCSDAVTFGGGIMVTKASGLGPRASGLVEAEA
jgi:hypothetical protein